jgi:hypothetical protein
MDIPPTQRIPFFGWTRKILCRAAIVRYMCYVKNMDDEKLKSLAAVAAMHFYNPIHASPRRMSRWL